MPVWEWAEWPIVPFVLGCFCDFGAEEAQFLYTLAFQGMAFLEQTMIFASKLSLLSSLRLTACNFVPTAFVKARLGFLLLWLRLQ